ncbi:MAG: HNH endonuclease [Pseudomonadota bacterium]|nr:HNH endonuclease [Pseudomonadota bacterium]
MEFFNSAPESHIKKERQKSRELKLSKWWQQKLNEGICYYCDQKFSRLELTMDHKVPLARGGVSSRNNIVIACKKCNSEKKYKTPVELLLRHDQ